MLCGVLKANFKGSSGTSLFIFEINVGKSRIRHTTTQKLNDDVTQILGRSLSDPALSDTDFKMAWVCSFLETFMLVTSVGDRKS